MLHELGRSIALGGWGAGIPIIAGLLISIASEHLGWFQAMKSKNKVGVYIVLCLIVPVASTAAAIATGVWGDWADIQTTWWPAIRAGLAAASLGTIFHVYTPPGTRLLGMTLHCSK